MSDKYKIFKGQDESYFVTFTIIDWLEVLTDESFKLIIIDSIKYCQKEKGLIVYAYCIMPNHVHMMILASGRSSISDILRDLKKFTAKAIISKLQLINNDTANEFLKKFEEAGKNLKRIKKYKVLQDGNQAKLLYSNKFIWEKLKYIHNNPVKKGLYDEEENYKFSSATNYAGLESLLNIECLSRQLITI